MHVLQSPLKYLSPTYLHRGSFGGGGVSSGGGGGEKYHLNRARTHAIANCFPSSNAGQLAVHPDQRASANCFLHMHKHSGHRRTRGDRAGCIFRVLDRTACASSVIVQAGTFDAPSDSRSASRKAQNIWNHVNTGLPSVEQEKCPGKRALRVSDPESV